MDILKDIGPIAQIVSAVAIAVGYFLLIRDQRDMLRERREERIAGGRPQVVLATDYSHFPQVNLVVHNFTEAPAKEVTFEFSASVEDSDGLVLSDLRFFKEGLPFLQPRGRVSCYWDSLPSLIPLLKEKGLEDGISVTTRYKDLAEESYETEWKIHPLLFEGAPLEASLGMNDLVAALEKVSGDDVERNGRQRPASSEESQGGPD